MDTTKTPLNFTYGERTPEAETIINNLSKDLFIQTALIQALFTQEYNTPATDLIDSFCYENIHNLFPDIEDDEADMQEIYAWYACFLPEYAIEALKEDGHPIIQNEYGTWIGRTDWGSAWDIYFLPSIAYSIYREPEQD